MAPFRPCWYLVHALASDWTRPPHGEPTEVDAKHLIQRYVRDNPEGIRRGSGTGRPPGLAPSQLRSQLRAAPRGPCSWHPLRVDRHPGCALRRAQLGDVGTGPSNSPLYRPGLHSPCTPRRQAAPRSPSSHREGSPSTSRPRPPSRRSLPTRSTSACTRPGVLSDHGRRRHVRPGRGGSHRRALGQETPEGTEDKAVAVIANRITLNECDHVSPETSHEVDRYTRATASNPRGRLIPAQRRELPDEHSLRRPAEPHRDHVVLKGVQGEVGDHTTVIRPCSQGDSRASEVPPRSRAVTEQPI